MRRVVRVSRTLTLMQHPIEHGGFVATVRLAGAAPLADWFGDALATLQGGTARVLLIDATGEPPAGWTLPPAELAALVLFELPTVFVFEGALRGSALEFAFAFDIRVCGADASVRGPLRGTSRLQQLSGPGGGMRILTSREPVPAQDLLAAGYVSTVTPSGEALTEATRLAHVVASRGPIATRLAKEALWRGLGMPLDQALRFETDLTLLLQTTKDRAEGVRAFLEKRRPEFAGE